VADSDDGAVDLEFTEAAVERLGELAADTPGQPLVLRLTVEGGGCSGFTYHFILDQEPAPDDRVVSKGQATLVCDPVSYEFVRGSTIDYTTDIIRSAFEVVSNPNAEASCGCGSSFAPKG
jgi:iron-sulfur cluster assembly accessory protein